MARTITEIYDSMVAEKETMPELVKLQPAIDNHQSLLNDLTSTSKVALWRLLFWVISVAIWIVETLFDVHKEEIETLLNNSIPGTTPWYRLSALNFQFGDTLVWLNNKYQYPAIDTSKQVVDQAAVIEQNGIVLIKTAKDTGSILEPLSTSEFTAFKSYMAKIKFAGTILNYINDTADLLKVYYDIYYDPLLLAPDGSLLSDSGTFPAEDAITNYIKNLPFNGNLNLTKLTDAVQSAIGVIDPVLNSANAKYSGNPYSVITANYLSNAGYLIIDPSFPLSATLNYIANV